MSYRNRLAKPSAALWSLVAAAHLVTMTAVAAIQTVLTVAGGLLACAVAGAGLWLLRGSTGGARRTLAARGAGGQVPRSR